jgi:hypothetical protein
LYPTHLAVVFQQTPPESLIQPMRLRSHHRRLPLDLADVDARRFIPDTIPISVGMMPVRFGLPLPRESPAEGADSLEAGAVRGGGFVCGSVFPDRVRGVGGLTPAPVFLYPEGFAGLTRQGQSSVSVAEIGHGMLRWTR